MSKETLTTLNTLQLIGFTENRGTAWHYRADHQGTESNHYPLAIPAADVERRLFHWTAVKRPMQSSVPAGMDEFTALDQQGMAICWRDDEDVVALYRDDTWVKLATVSTTYEPHQYSEWLIGVLSNIIGDSLSIGSAGLLKNGAVAYVQVEVPENIETPEGVAFRPNLLATTCFDRSIATTYKRTVTVVVCDNTREAALNERGQVFKTKHVRGSTLHIDQARQALRIIESTADEFAAEVRQLCQTSVSAKQWSAFLNEFAPTTVKGRKLTGRALSIAGNKQDALNRLWSHDERVTPWKSSAYGVVQAVNTWKTHEQTVRNTSRPERNMLNAITGTQAKSDVAALTLLTNILQAA